jgi:hypothetical protein
MRLLVAQDNYDTAKVYKLALKHRGHRVTLTGIKEMYSTFQFIIFFSNNPKTFLKSHPSWKVQPLILVFGIKISEAQVASL